MWRETGRNDWESVTLDDTHQVKEHNESSDNKTRAKCNRIVNNEEHGRDYNKGP